jgi:hypothetical protein
MKKIKKVKGGEADESGKMHKGRLLLGKHAEADGEAVIKAPKMKKEKVHAEADGEAMKKIKKVKGGEADESGKMHKGRLLLGKHAEADGEAVIKAPKMKKEKKVHAEADGEAIIKAPKMKKEKVHAEADGEASHKKGGKKGKHAGEA